MHDQQPGTSAFTAVGAPQLNTVTNLPEVRPTGTPSPRSSITLPGSLHTRHQPLQARLRMKSDAEEHLTVCYCHGRSHYLGSSRLTWRSSRHSNRRSNRAASPAV
jgi:hypothetical protein